MRPWQVGAAAAAMQQAAIAKVRHGAAAAATAAAGTLDTVTETDSGVDAAAVRPPSAPPPHRFLRQAKRVYGGPQRAPPRP